jgi:hypothetical protein
MDAPDATYRTLPCRPTIACTADVTPPGAFELEAGALYRRNHAGGRQWTLPFLAKLTAADWVQFQLGSNGLTTTRGDGSAQYFDDVLLGAKLHLLDQTAWLPALALSATASLPTFAGQTGYVRTYDGLFAAYATKDFGRVHADFNTGLNAWRLENSPRPQEYAALAVSTNLPSPLSLFGLMGEVYYFTDASPVASRDGGILFALAHSPRSWLTFDFGGDVGFFPATRAYSVFIGMSIIPVLLWKRAGR